MRSVFKKLREYRFIGYIVGLLLFFAPFALYQRALIYFLGFSGNASIHTACLRTPILRLLEGQVKYIFTISMLGFALILLVAFLFGPLFCGRLCFSGALPEYLGRLVPDRFKVDWTKKIDPLPIRYGFLLGFIASPFISGTIAHAYCNFALTETLIEATIYQNILQLTSTMVITLFLWLILFGLFTKGGRGFCNYLCPIGTMQGFMHFLGSKFSGSYRLKIDSRKCTRCNACIDGCPMRACREKDKMPYIEKQHCIACQACIGLCPTKAISYGNGRLESEVEKSEKL